MKRLLSILLIALALPLSAQGLLPNANLHVQSAAPSNDFLTGLVVYYAGEDATDSHTSGLDLTPDNAPTYTAGKISNAFTLNGSTQSLYHTDHTAFAIGNQSMTVSFWMYFSSDSNMVPISKWYNGVDEEWFVYRRSSDGTAFFFVTADGSTNVNVQASTFGALSTGTWYFVTCGYDHSIGNIWIQINAGTRDATSHSMGIYNGLMPLMIGVRPDSSAFYFPGQIDEVALWIGRSLTTTEVTGLKAIYDAGGSYGQFACLYLPHERGPLWASIGTDALDQVTYDFTANEPHIYTLSP